MERLSEEQRRLAEDALPRVDRIARRYERQFPEYEADIRSSALWGAVRAAESYRQDGGTTWERWSNFIIRGEVKEFLRSRQSYEYAATTPASLMSGRAVGEEHEDWISTVPDPRADHAGSGLDLDAILRPLTERQRDILRLVYAEGLRPSEAGKRLGMYRNNGCRVHNEALDRLRAELAA